jgi:hypothetical protein
VASAGRRVTTIRSKIKPVASVTAEGRVSDTIGAVTYINVTWPAPPASGQPRAALQLYRDEVLLDTLSAGARSYSDTTAPAGTSHSYALIVVSNAGHSSLPTRSAAVLKPTRPVWTGVPTQIFRRAGGGAAFAGYVSDTEGGALTYSLQARPDVGYTINASTGQVSIGTTTGTLTVRATDSLGLFADTSLTVRITNPETREWRPGHWLAIGDGSGRRNTYHTGTGNNDLLALPGVQGIQLRYKWSDLEPTPGVFDLSSIATDLTRVATKNSRLIVFLEDKSFDGQHITPTDLRAAAYEQAWSLNGNTGYTAARWNSTIVSRWAALIQAVGTAFDSNPSFHGIAFPETATSLDAAARTASSYDEYDYRDAIIAELQTASVACPTSRVFWYQNFMPARAQDVRLDEVAEAIRDYNGGSSSNGIIMGGPDILPDSDSINDRVLPRYLEMAGVLDMFCCFQNDSYEHDHTATSDPRMPGYSWTIGSVWTMADLFVFARDYMQLDYILWNYKITAGEQDWEPEGRQVVGANPTFNT